MIIVKDISFIGKKQHGISWSAYGSLFYLRKVWVDYILA